MPRIDLQSIKGKVEFKDLKIFGSDKAKIIFPKWKWIKGDSYILASFNGLKRKTWTLVGLRFIPKNTGKVKLMLTAERKNGKESEVYYDNLEIKGTTGLNQDFEKVVSNKKLPLNWQLMNLGKNRKVFASYSNEYKQKGNFSALVYYGSRLTQTFTVTKDKPVIIEAWVYVP